MFASVWQGDKVKEPEVWKGFRDLFPVLEEELNLEYGRILLASASPAELQAILARDWPYLDSFAKEVDTCLDGDCTRVATIVQQLGTPTFSCASANPSNLQERSLLNQFSIPTSSLKVGDICLQPSSHSAVCLVLMPFRPISKLRVLGTQSAMGSPPCCWSTGNSVTR